MKVENPKLKISFLTTNGKSITLPCHIREDGSIVTEPFTQDTTITGWVNLLTEDNTKNMNNSEQDKEVQLVNQFISDLNQVLDEMESVEQNDYYKLVLDIKLLKLKKRYEDSLPFSSPESYKSYYNYLLSQRQKKKEEKPKMSIFDNKGNTITLLYSVREDGYIECEPFSNDAIIVGFKFDNSL